LNCAQVFLSDLVTDDRTLSELSGEKIEHLLLTEQGANALILESLDHLSTLSFSCDELRARATERVEDDSLVRELATHSLCKDVECIDIFVLWEGGENSLTAQPEVVKLLNSWVLCIFRVDCP